MSSLPSVRAIGRKNLFGISLSFALLVSAVACGYYSGYRYGYIVTPVEPQNAVFVSRTYDEADFVGTRPRQNHLVRQDLEAICDLLVQTIAPASWDLVGGQGKVDVNPGTLTLTIYQSEANHKQIENLLEQLRNPMPVPTGKSTDRSETRPFPAS